MAGYRINVKNFKVALVTMNSASEYEIGELHPIPGLMAIDFTPQMATGQLYGDGELREDIGKITGATVKLDANKIPITERALMTGSTYKDGILDIATTDTPPAVAVYCETQASNGSKEQMWFLNAKAQPFGIAGKQQEGNINYSTDTLTLGCMPRELDHKVVRLADTEGDAITAEDSAKLALHPDKKTPVTDSTEGDESESTESTEPTE